MNPVHIHLLLNHVPIMAAIFSAALWLFAVLRKNDTIKKVALAGFILAALGTIPVHLTGEPAEESVEHLAGISENVIETHEEAAAVSTWLIAVSGLVALGALIYRKKWLSSPALAVAVTVLSLVSTAAVSYTGYLGGQIRHTEIAGNAAGNANPENGGENGEGADDDD